MIPLGDSVPSQRTPFVNYLLLAVNVFVFFYEVVLGPEAEAFIQMWGTTPADVLMWQQQPTVLVTLVTSMFLHGGWFHLIGNMLYLGIFGDNVEGIMGHRRYLFFYLLCGVVANVAQILITPASSVPGIGASGAIAGVLAAYLLSFPRARVFVGILVLFMRVYALPAMLVLGFWFVMQLFNGLAAIVSSGDAALGGVAWWAHIGGFATGLILTPILRQRRRHQVRCLGTVDSRYKHW
jgi:membrane associated rhomboid family serine protease